MFDFSGQDRRSAEGSRRAPGGTVRSRVEHGECITHYNIVRGLVFQNGTNNLESRIKSSAPQIDLFAGISGQSRVGEAVAAERAGGRARAERHAAQGQYPCAYA